MNLCAFEIVLQIKKDTNKMNWMLKVESQPQRKQKTSQ